MRMKILLSFLLLFTLLYGVNQKEILLSQARMFERSRNYERAENFYAELMKEFPNDKAIFKKRFQNLQRMNDKETLNTILGNWKSKLSAYEFYNYEIQYLAQKRDIDEIEKKTIKFMNKKRFNEKKINEITSLLQRSGAFKLSAELIIEYRKKLKKKDLFAFTQARNYEYLSAFEESIKEYLIHLENNPSYLNYISNRFKQFLQKDENVILILAKYCKQSKNVKVRELYANVLKLYGNYKEAYEMYLTLGGKKIFLFAEEMRKMKKYDLAGKGLLQYRKTLKDRQMIIGANLGIASIFVETGQLAKADSLLNDVLDSTKRREYSKVLRQYPRFTALKLKSNIAIQQNNIPKAIEILEQAENETTNNRERITLKLDKLQWQLFDGKNIEKELQRINISDYYKNQKAQKLYLQYFSQPTYQDSLLTDLVTFYGDSHYTNDVIFWHTMIKNETKENQKTFWEIYKHKKMNQNSSLKDFSVSKNIEEMSDLIKISNIDRNYNNYNDIFYEGYDLLLYSESQTEIEEFIKDNPAHIFNSALRTKASKLKKKTESYHE